MLLATSFFQGWHDLLFIYEPCYRLNPVTVGGARVSGTDLSVCSTLTVHILDDVINPATLPNGAVGGTRGSSGQSTVSSFSGQARAPSSSLSQSSFSSRARTQSSSNLFPTLPLPEGAKRRELTSRRRQAGGQGPSGLGTRRQSRGQNGKFGQKGLLGLLG